MLILEEVKSALRSSIDILRSDIYFSGNYSDCILKLLFFKWLSDRCEENYLGRDEISTYYNLFKGANWSAIKTLEQDIGKQLTDIFHLIEKVNPKLQDIFINPKVNQWKQLSDLTLKRLIQKFSSLDLGRKNLKQPELLGEIHEDLIINSGLYAVKATENYFTPRSITKLMVDLVAPQVEMQICDPDCGSGGMLIECVRYLKEKGEDPNSLRLYGQEEVYELQSIAKINLLLHGVAHPEISSANLIQSPLLSKNGELQKFNVVITNPPFGVKNWEDYQAKQDIYHYFHYGYPPKSSADYAIIQRILATLNDTGKAVIIVPHGVLFRGSVEGEIRKNIVEDDLIESIIGLPQNLFYSTKIATALIIFNKEKPKNRKKKILFIDASHEYESRRNQNFLTNEIISKIVSTYFSFQEETGYSKIASHQEIASYDYTLTIGRYVELQNLGNSSLDIGLQVEKIKTLEAQRDEIEAQMDDCLKALGIEI